MKCQLCERNVICVTKKNEVCSICSGCSDFFCFTCSNFEQCRGEEVKMKKKEKKDIDWELMDTMSMKEMTETIVYYLYIIRMYETLSVDFLENVSKSPAPDISKLKYIEESLKNIQKKIAEYSSNEINNKGIKIPINSYQYNYGRGSLLSYD